MTVAGHTVTLDILLAAQLGWNTLEVCRNQARAMIIDNVQNSRWTDRNTGITVYDSKHAEYERTWM